MSKATALALYEAPGAEERRRKYPVADEHDEAPLTPLEVRKAQEWIGYCWRTGRLDASASLKAWVRRQALAWYEHQGMDAFLERNEAQAEKDHKKKLAMGHRVAQVAPGRKKIKDGGAQEYLFDAATASGKLGSGDDD